MLRLNLISLWQRIPKVIAWRANLRSHLLGLFVISLSLSCLAGSCDQLPNRQVLSIGINNWVGYSIALYARSSGIFARRGLEVKLVHFNNQQDNIRATMRGSQDASFVPLWEVMQVDPANDKPVFIMVTDISAGSDGIVARQGFNSVKGLKGGRIGAKLGTVAHLILLEALKSHNLKPEDVTIQDVSNERSSNLLEQGLLDAAVMWEPNLSKTAKDIDGKVIFTTKDVDSLVIDGLATRSTVLKDNQDWLSRFILAWFDTIHAVETNPDQVFEAIAREIKQTKAIVARDYSGLIKGDIAMNRRMFIPNGRLREATAESAKLLRADQRHGRIIRDDVEINSEFVLKAINDWQP
ncbi:ABC-type nitrate/sulfonate/bicarbonate transport system, periplasmic component [Synechococcus sp. PCC 7502]|uniref:ABC transporter substrate-binding protein n=1 Tax=Synechococcus sp. PCC 7502 TaxID=1173263 RepID=UPI00029FB61B|nr:ABC transporter substrate-binding protein [Synechococcus sp. PCC 7502]AFY75198.1 ABC-type nitrate/sulfonate/bicarbonate transport system, periplasmic component [Synechococcus sp. PCC 7502]